MNLGSSFEWRTKAGVYKKWLLNNSDHKPYQNKQSLQKITFTTYSFIKMIKPRIAFHPWEYLADALEIKGWSQTQFAAIINISKYEINDLVKWRRNITPRIAGRIGEALDTPSSVWLNLQNIYDLYKIDLNKEEFKQKEAIRKRLKEFVVA
jgi:addiction module HigA family antidote